MALRCSVHNFLWKDNMVQTKQSISRFLKSDITLFSSQFSPKTQLVSNELVCFWIFLKMTWRYSVLYFLFKPSSPFLHFLNNDITLFHSQFFLKRQHGWDQVVYFWILSKITWCYSVLNFRWKDNMVQTK